jgi:pyrroloquinoline quinone biosynthesis protein B
LGHTVGLLLRDAATKRSRAFVPGCGLLDDALLARLAHADLVLLDGTFWDDAEPVRLGIGPRTATAMGHVPITGPGGSLERLASLGGPRRVYTHLNNTNPVLLERSAERRAVEAAGVEVGEDGMQFDV